MVVIENDFQYLVGMQVDVCVAVGVPAVHAQHSLALAPPGSAVLVTALALEADLTAWVRAVGIREGERVVVLRRAAFGGPIHVRTASGGEFALGRSVAHSVVVREARAA